MARPVADVKIDLRNLRRQSEEDIVSALKALGLEPKEDLQWETLSAVVQRLLVATATRRAALAAMNEADAIEQHLKKRNRIVRTKMRTLIGNGRTTMEHIFMAIECEADARVEFACEAS